MNVGLPGTGIGGLFYLILAILMPVCELWKTARGSSSVQRWRSTGALTTMAVAILSALWGESWLIKRGFQWAATHGVLGSQFTHPTVLGRVLPAGGHLVALASILTLGTLLLLLHGAGMFLGLRSARASDR